jgi:hypothetical protein
MDFHGLFSKFSKLLVSVFYTNNFEGNLIFRYNEETADFKKLGEFGMNFKERSISYLLI